MKSTETHMYRRTCVELLAKPLSWLQDKALTADDLANLQVLLTTAVCLWHFECCEVPLGFEAALVASPDESLWPVAALKASPNDVAGLGRLENMFHKG